MSAERDWLDGSGLVAWLRSRGLHALDLQLDSHARRVRDWEDGALANVFTVDAVLVKLGLHLPEIPDDLWCDPPDRTGANPRPRHETVRRKRSPYSPELKEEIARRHLLGGEGIRALAREVGCDPSSVSKWAREFAPEDAAA